MRPEQRATEHGEKSERKKKGKKRRCVAEAEEAEAKKKSKSEKELCEMEALLAAPTSFREGHGNKQKWPVKISGDTFLTS